MDIGSLILMMGADIRDIKKKIASVEKMVKGYTKTTDKELNKTDKRWKKSGTAISSSIKSIGSAVALYFGVSKITEWSKAIVDAGVTIQSLENAFGAVTGSLGSARAELGFVAETAYDLGLNVRALEDSFKTLAAASMRTKLEGAGARDVFYAVAEASTAMQLSATQTHASLYALQQMMSKGRVQTEELRRQLGEQLPGAFQMAADAMGVTTFELNKMLEMGQVVSEDFLPKFAKVLHERFGRAAVKNAELARGAFNRFGNEVIYLKRTLATAGFTDFFSDIARTATQVMNEFSNDVGQNSKEIAEFFDEIGDAFRRNITGIDVDSVIDSLRRLGGTLKTIKTIFETIPGEIIGATGVGIVGRFLFGGQVGVVLGALSLLNGSMDRLGMGLGSLVDKHYAAGEAIIKLYKSVAEHTTGVVSLGFDSDNLNTLQEIENALFETSKRYQELSKSSEMYVKRYGEPKWARAQKEEMIRLSGVMVDLRKKHIQLKEIWDTPDQDVLAFDIPESFKELELLLSNMKVPEELELDSDIMANWKLSTEEARRLKKELESLENVMIDVALLEPGEWGFGDIDDILDNLDKVKATLTDIEKEIQGADIDESLLEWFDLSAVKDDAAEFKAIHSKLYTDMQKMNKVWGYESSLVSDTVMQGYGDDAAAFKESAEKKFKDMQKMNKLIGNEAYLAAASFKDPMLESLEAIQRAAEQVFKNMEDALVDWVMTGKFNFKDFANSVIADLMRIEAKKLTASLSEGISGGGFMDLLKSAGSSIMGMFGSSTPTPTINPSGAVFHMAGGGVINEHVVGVGQSSGKSYEFGENGSEMVIPGGGLSGGGSTTNIYISAIDTQSFSEYVRKNPESIVSVVGENITGKGALRSTIKGAL